MPSLINQISAPKSDSEEITPEPLVASPSHSSGRTSPTLNEVEDIPEITPSAQRKKKKRKPKKSSKAKADAALKASKTGAPIVENRPPVLCISRNKHWRYISSYHGPWLQLPLELLESLLVLNLDPATLATPEVRLPQITYSPTSTGFTKPRLRGFESLGDNSPSNSPRSTFANLPPPPPFPSPTPGKATPPPIDPGVFRSVIDIRKLIDEAAELSVRATSGLSAAALGSIRGGSSGINNSPWATAQSLGINPLGDGGNPGRNVAMSAMRTHRLRALAVQKLAQAYKADEIASSVMVMQGGSVFDDIAERVLRVDPNDIDAKYVHFFHEKIPSRQLAESTTTCVLDELIAAQPQRLEFYRTRGIVHCFRDEYSKATKDFTHALKEARAVRKAKIAHRNTSNQSESRGKGGRKRKDASRADSYGSATTNGSDNTVEGPDGESLLLHPSAGPDAPDPIEPQVLFLRGAAFLQHAVFLIEEAILKLEGIRKLPSIDGAELRLCYLENGNYGGVEIGHPDGPLGRKDGEKVSAYRRTLADGPFREHITMLVRKSLRDHEKYLGHFHTIETHNASFAGDIAQRTEHAFLLSESLRPGTHAHAQAHAHTHSHIQTSHNGKASSHPLSDTPCMFTTYHPLLVESHFSILICQLLLADFPSILPTFARTAALVDGLEGYPIFLPPRSMAQAEFVEVLERLAGGWRVGVMPHSLLRGDKGRLRIEAPPDAEEVQGSDATSDAASTSTSRRKTTATTPKSSNSTLEPPVDPSQYANLIESLDCARILLAPVVTRQKQRAEKAAAEKLASMNGSNKKKKPLSTISIPLHGPRVEIILAWLGAVHLVELDSVA